MQTLELIGPRPFDLDVQGRLQTRIGTVFPEYSALVTRQPGLHALQRLGFIDLVNTRRAAQNLPALTPEQEEALSANSVDLIFEADHILIRPDPDHMDLAFAADELLQTLVSKREIKFLSVADQRVRGAIKRRGECWRLSSLPKTREGKKQLIFSSKVAINSLPIYFYNRLTGVRWLTCQDFEELGQLDDAALRRQLREIADYSARTNRQGRREIDFFAVDLLRFGAADFAGINFEETAAEPLRRKFEELNRRFRAGVHEGFRRNDCNEKAWCERILATLFLEGNEAQTEQILSGLSPEFFMQVEWLPGGRFEEGEFLFDPIFEEAAQKPADLSLQRLCDLRAKGIIVNLLRDYGDMEFVNVGSVPESLSIDRPQLQGRRAVYLVELKLPHEMEPRKRLLRFQKWGVWEHLDEQKDLLQSIQESDGYTDYCLDRRLGCKQLGMNLVKRIIVRHLVEIYRGNNEKMYGASIRTAYFEREYLPGIATDKLPLDRYARPGYAEELARLLGRAACSSLVVGRSLESGTRAVFDDGDEVVEESAAGMPVDLLVADHTGAFAEYLRPLETFAAAYARPVNKRERIVPDARAFAEIYLETLAARLTQIQADYRKRRRAFDTLFKHCTYDPRGSFAYRWECVLRRLDATQVDSLIQSVRAHIAVLSGIRK